MAASHGECVAPNERDPNRPFAGRISIRCHQRRMSRFQSRSAPFDLRRAQAIPWRSSPRWSFTELHCFTERLELDRISSRAASCAPFEVESPARAVRVRGGGLEPMASWRALRYWLACAALAACAIDDREVGVGVADATVAANRPDPGTCSPGETQCASATEAADCGADGLWGAPRPCDGPCINGRCGGGECTPNTAECLSVTRVRRCSDAGAWAEPEECEFACVAGGCGGLCKPSQTRCASAADVETCSPEGQWGPPTACAEGCSGDACVGECSFGDGRCASSTQAQSCSELEQWQAPVSCLNACAEGA